MSNHFKCKLCSSRDTSAPVCLLALGVCRDCAMSVLAACTEVGWSMRRIYDRNPQDTKTVIPEGLRWEVFERDGHKCKHCGSGRWLRADHIVPECRGGPTTLDNLQTLCRSCNSRKGARAA